MARDLRRFWTRAAGEPRVAACRIVASGEDPGDLPARWMRDPVRPWASELVVQTQPATAGIGVRLATLRTPAAAPAASIGRTFAGTGHAAGVADGKRLATHWTAEDRLAAIGVDVVRDARWVRDGTVVSSQGVSAGIDMALWLVAQLHSPAHARATQRATSRTTRLRHTPPRSDPDIDPEGRGREATRSGVLLLAALIGCGAPAAEPPAAAPGEACLPPPVLDAPPERVVTMDGGAAAVPRPTSPARRHDQRMSGAVLRTCPSVRCSGLRFSGQPGAARRTRPTAGRARPSGRQRAPVTGPYRVDVDDTISAEPLAVPARMALFLVGLVLVAGAGWGIGRVANPPLPAPDLPAPSVLQSGTQPQDAHGHEAGS